ncbi:hypothetical protein, partial [Lonsdalea iberica]|uniref:hypothetical protein n=1 Tax=Lonsdalea iberica TaxID=1082703 RepID=UPI001C384D1D
FLSHCFITEFKIHVLPYPKLAQNIAQDAQIVCKHCAKSDLCWEVRKKLRRLGNYSESLA